MIHRLPIVALLLAAVAAVAPARAAAASDSLVELSVNGRKLEGLLLARDKDFVHLLGRDGRLWHIRAGEARGLRETAQRFRGYSPSELRAALLRELGPGYEVTGTSHYLVAHQAGQRDAWAERFEELYRSFVHYFTVRGLKPRQPPTPLLAVVCRDRAEFNRYARSQGISDSPGLQGLYALDSNRVSMYDMGGDARQWQRNASVILHEVTHQTAFNAGIHSRTAPPPLWVAEGLATMFEAPGVYDSRNYPHQSERIDRERLASFRRYAPQHRPELLAALAASDDLFRTHAGMAYAEAWALTFYLVETQPQKYGQYLARTAARPAFAPYTAAERTADFTACFGSDWKMLSARLVRFIDELK